MEQNRKFRFQTWTIPLALLVLCSLGFGLSIPWLGYYWDDWPAIATIRLRGVGAFWDFYQSERPFSAWTYVLSGPLLGTNTFYWHVFSLLLRWSTVLGMWWSLGLLWPSRKTETTWMAILFAIYPTFTQQPVAVAFSQHWITFSLYFLSTGLMLLSLRRPMGYWLFTGLALATSAVQTLTMEYFIGLELLRPVFTWCVISEDVRDRKARLRQTVLRWLPYALVIAGAVIWRLLFQRFVEDVPNPPVLLYEFLRQPLSTLMRLAQLSIQEVLFNLFGAWQSTLNPLEFDLADRLYRTALAWGGLAAILAIVYLFNLSEAAPKDGSDEPGWHRQAIGLGLLAILLGSLPGMLIERLSLVGVYGSRFGLAAMFGASILVVGLLDWLTPRSAPKVILIGLLAGLAVAFHIRSTDAYVQAWAKQHGFYWQLHWRAPYLEPGTALYAQDELFPYVGRYQTSLALNLLYPPVQGPAVLPYWFVELAYHFGKNGTPDLVAGKPLEFSLRNFRFQGHSLDGLAISYEPEKDRCLWVLGPEDRFNPELPGMTEDVLSISNPDRIKSGAMAQGYPPEDIFGKEPFHSWCYYYQKADLARQAGDWEQVVALAEQALAEGYKPENPHERLPFIEAHAHTGDWSRALADTRKAYDKDERYARQLCYLWERLDQELEIPAEAAGDLAKLLDRMDCTAISS